MAMSVNEKREALDRLYARLPKIQCKRKCQRYCGIVPMHQIEQERIAEQIGHKPEVSYTPGGPVPKDLRVAPCPLLNADGRCSVYGLRPLICRVWGTAKDMACPHGCKPSRWISDKEFTAILIKIRDIETR